MEQGCFDLTNQKFGAVIRLPGKAATISPNENASSPRVPNTKHNCSSTIQHTLSAFYPVGPFHRYCLC